MFSAHSYPFPSLYVTCKKISKCQNITLKIRVRRFLLYKHISTRTTEVISAEILFLMLLVIIYNFIAYVQINQTRYYFRLLPRPVVVDCPNKIASPTLRCYYKQSNHSFDLVLIFSVSQHPRFLVWPRFVDFFFSWSVKKHIL